MFIYFWTFYFCFDQYFTSLNVFVSFRYQNNLISKLYFQRTCIIVDIPSQSPFTFMYTLYNLPPSHGLVSASEWGAKFPFCPVNWGGSVVGLEIHFCPVNLKGGGGRFGNQVCKQLKHWVPREKKSSSWPNPPLKSVTISLNLVLLFFCLP